jgi:hypothetical protein
MFNVQGSEKPLMLGCNKNLFSQWNIILVGGDANKGGGNSSISNKEFRMSKV